MDFTSIAGWIWAQVVTVWYAPVPFLAALLLSWWLFSLYYKSHYRERIAAKDATIEQKESLIQEYKEKLSGATPEEAKKQIEALSQQVNRLTRQRALTAEQKRKIADILRVVEPPGPNAAEIIYPQTSHEGAVFANDIVEALRAGGWDVRADTTLIGGRRLDKRGLAIAVHDIQQKASFADQLGAALRAAGLEFTWEQEEGCPARLYIDLID